jgi:hypothetical protein
VNRDRVIRCSENLPLPEIIEVTMRTLTSAFLLLAALVVAAPSVSAQQKRVSPHETISTVINGNRVTIVYGRPYSKDPKTGEIRKVWGGIIGTGINPWGKAWRAGSDEATLLITQKPLMIGDTAVPAGAYTLYVVPNADGSAKLVINKQLGQWGLQYDAGQDLARVDLTRSDITPSVDEFTIVLAKNPAGGGLLEMQWETTQYSVAYTVQP